MLHRLIGEDIGISTVLQSDLWSVRGDKGNLEQIILNLSVNARDAMSEGGRIIIRTDNVVIDKDYCELYPEGRPGEFIRLSVSDTGAGIESNLLPRIFEPFFSTKGVGKGTGLGLSVVYGIVRQHSGWITVNSIPNHGSTFEVYLPAVKEKVSPHTTEKVSIHGLKGNGEKILVVEDSEGVKKFLKSALSENGYQIFIASNALEAQKIFHRYQGKLDLVFSDVVLPDHSGIELVQTLLKEKPDLKILLSSGYTDQKSQWAVIQNRHFPFIQKPYSLIGLLKTIKRII
jgi:two-component system cell cycle sensor histidine kinase/response regulator CckA